MKNLTTIEIKHILGGMAGPVTGTIGAGVGGANGFVNGFKSGWKGRQTVYPIKTSKYTGSGNTVNHKKTPQGKKGR